MEDYGTATFQARKSYKRLIPLFAFFGCFIIIGIFVFVTSDQTAGLIMMIFGAAPQIIFLLVALSPRSHYQVGINEIHLKKGLSRRTIPLSEIKAAKKLNAEQTSLLLNEYHKSSIESERSLDIKSWYRSNKMYGGFIKFCTVPIIQQRTTRGHSRNVVAFGTRTSGDFVMLRQGNDDDLLLSPVDPDGFLARLKSSASIAADIDIETHLSKLDAAKPKANAKRQKIWRVYRIAAFATTAAIAIVIFFLVRGGRLGSSAPLETDENRPAPTNQITESGEISLGWVDKNTYHIEVKSPLTVPALKDEEARKKNLRMAVQTYYQFDIVGNLINDYLVGHDLQLDAESHATLHEKLMVIFTDIQAALLREEFAEDFSSIASVVEVSGDAIQDLSRNIIAAHVGE